MNATPQPHVGGDIAKDKFDVALLLEQSVHRQVFANNRRGHAAFLKWLKHHNSIQAHVCLEATGRYSQALALFLHQHQIRVSVVNPLAVYHFAKSEMSRTKTDQHDALILARYCKDKQPRLWQPPAPDRQHLAQCVRLREQLVANRVLVAQQQSDAPKELARFFASQRRLLDRQLLQVQKQIDECLQGSSNLHRDSQLIESIPGIARTTAATVLAMMPPVQELNSARQLAAFAGVTPRQDQSGLRTGRSRLCKLGHARLRKSLYFPAIVAMRCNSRVRALAQRLAKKGKPKMSIIGACMRQLLHLIYGVLKTGLPFDPNYPHVPATE